jgi:hypothetical protein
MVVTKLSRTAINHLFLVLKQWFVEENLSESFLDLYAVNLICLKYYYYVASLC